jgi:DNA modification methylase
MRTEYTSPRGDVVLYQGNAVDVLAALPDGSVRCCVTSPPYWGLRDYGTGRWEGGEEGCDHKSNRQAQGATGQRADRTFTGGTPFTSECGKCGARRIDQQIGLEETPDAYVAKMVSVFREVRRVLADDGTCWVNLGDSYAAQRGGTCMPAETLAGGEHGKTDSADPLRGRQRHGGHQAHRDAESIGLKHKDLVGIPWRVAFALQADGWYLRQDIIWHKPNPMPESVTDRCTKAHEYIFLLSKSARYFFDAKAIAETSETGDMRRPYTSEGAWEMDGRPMEQRHGGELRRPPASATFKRTTKDHLIPNQQAVQHRDEREDTYPTGTRNRRSVWTIAPEPSSVNHFAAYPTKLVEPCILAGSAPGDTVLDPFCGTATTGAVAVKRERKFIGIDLSKPYLDISRERLEGELARRDGGLFGPAPLEQQGKLL